MDEDRTPRALRVSVVIPVRDDARELEVCLALLARQTVEPFEVVVVDNGSSDDSADVARRAGARVVSESRVGIPAAAAAGYDAARGEIIARLDADSRPGPGWVARAVERLTGSPDLAAVTGTGRFHDLPRLAAPLVSLGYLGSFYLLTHLALARTPLWGSCMAIRRTAWLAVREEVERLDPEVHDDVDLSACLPSSSRTRLDPRWRVDVAARSLRGRSQRRRRLARMWRTLERAWSAAPPWTRWRARRERPTAGKLAAALWSARRGG